MAKTENQETDNMFIAARYGATQPLPPKKLRQFLRIPPLPQPVPKGGLICPTTPNANKKEE